MTDSPPHHAVFAVNKTPYCVWEWDLQARNLGFVESIDPAHFEYLAATHLEHVTGDTAQHAAISLRGSFLHALETHFMVLGAAIQAPDCAVGWFQKCQPRDLRQIVACIQRARHLPNQLGLTALSWEAIAERILLFCFEDAHKLAETRKAFARLWRRLAREFTDEANTWEHNSIKHGLRASPGPCTFRIGVEDVPGIPARPENMKTISHNPFGSSFFVAEQIQGSRESHRRDPHFRVRSHRVNWDPECMAHGLMLIALSIKNVRSFLQIRNGIDPSSVRFTRPVAHDVFDRPWSKSLRVTRMSFDSVVSEASICRVPRGALLQALEPHRENGTAD